MMNYIDLMNNFWRIDEQWAFNGNETRLYFFLLQIANRLFWEQEWLVYGDDRVKANVGISSAVLRTARDRLKEAKLLDFVVGGNGYRVKTRYKILTPISYPNQQAKPQAIYNKTKTKSNTSKSDNDDRFSKREFVASGSDFDE